MGKCYVCNEDTTKYCDECERSVCRNCSVHYSSKDFDLCDKCNKGYSKRKGELKAPEEVVKEDYTHPFDKVGKRGE